MSGQAALPGGKWPHSTIVDIKLRGLKGDSTSQIAHDTGVPSSSVSRFLGQGKGDPRRSEARVKADQERDTQLQAQAQALYDQYIRDGGVPSARTASASPAATNQRRASTSKRKQKEDSSSDDDGESETTAPYSAAKSRTSVAPVSKPSSSKVARLSPVARASTSRSFPPETKARIQPTRGGDVPARAIPLPATIRRTRHQAPSATEQPTSGVSRSRGVILPPPMTPEREERIRTMRQPAIPELTDERPAASSGSTASPSVVPSPPHPIATSSALPLPSRIDVPLTTSSRGARSGLPFPPLHSSPSRWEMRAGSTSAVQRSEAAASVSGDTLPGTSTSDVSLAADSTMTTPLSPGPSSILPFVTQEAQPVLDARHLPESALDLSPRPEGHDASPRLAPSTDPELGTAQATLDVDVEMSVNEETSAAPSDDGTSRPVPATAELTDDLVAQSVIEAQVNGETPSEIEGEAEVADAAGTEAQLHRLEEASSPVHVEKKEGASSVKGEEAVALLPTTQEVITERDLDELLVEESDGNVHVAGEQTIAASQAIGSVQAGGTRPDVAGSPIGGSVIEAEPASDSEPLPIAQLSTSHEAAEIGTSLSTTAPTTSPPPIVSEALEHSLTQGIVNAALQNVAKSSQSCTGEMVPTPLPLGTEDDPALVVEAVEVTAPLEELGAASDNPTPEMAVKKVQQGMVFGDDVSTANDAGLGGVGEGESDDPSSAMPS